MTAHITKRAYGYEVQISPTVSLRDATATYTVKTKREARALAARLGATPWNF